MLNRYNEAPEKAKEWGAILYTAFLATMFIVTLAMKTKELFAKRKPHKILPPKNHGMAHHAETTTDKNEQNKMVRHGEVPKDKSFMTTTQLYLTDQLGRNLAATKKKPRPHAPHSKKDSTEIARLIELRQAKRAAAKIALKNAQNAKLEKNMQHKQEWQNKKKQRTATMFATQASHEMIATNNNSLTTPQVTRKKHN
ncbi:hypothetical protein [Aquicella lusitana]|uniref:Uncharacterized protein n=1 Tax=Aquicella lusitana TaxID=254246 RepID=A0A370GDM5_9COXI|nr:hypothetical protein [Aquicella lusitana]RDI40083.1 hypothetical protein C8D86_12433 [Aquicella lusitana]VVC72363.1 hypothetical protein AQULUS_00730 [Aquicella lusitana]